LRIRKERLRQPVRRGQRRQGHDALKNCEQAAALGRREAGQCWHRERPIILQLKRGNKFKEPRAIDSGRNLHCGMENRHSGSRDQGHQHRPVMRLKTRNETTRGIVSREAAREEAYQIWTGTDWPSGVSRYPRPRISVPSSMIRGTPSMTAPKPAMESTLSPAFWTPNLPATRPSFRTN